MKEAILKSVDFERQNKERIPAFALALKRFMLRFLTVESQKEMEPLDIYLPDNLMIANTYAAYEFTMKKIEEKEKVEAMKKDNIRKNRAKRGSKGPKGGGSDH